MRLLQALLIMGRNPMIYPIVWPFRFADGHSKIPSVNSTPTPLVF